MKIWKYAVLSVAVVALAVVGFSMSRITSAAAPSASANGSGKLDENRQFSFSARQLSPDGTASGNAVLHNPAFTVNNNQRYALQIDVRCIKVIGNVAFVGGLTRRTNDPSLVDAVFFSVQDNGEPGKGSDQISRVFFWDDDPNTTGDPMACQLNQLGDFPMEPIQSGNVQVK